MGVLPLGVKSTCRNVFVRRKKKRDFCVNNSPIKWEGILQQLMMMTK